MRVLCSWQLTSNW